ncbi:MAG: hypothetical protein ABSA23_16365 [Anaerolineales bacterium]|jgi:hypothetical protein
MVTIKFSENPTQVMSFDGAVVELFHDISSRRIHVSLLENMQFRTDEKGRHILEFDAVAGGGSDEFEVDANAFPKVALLIAQVEKAKEAFQFD